MSLRSTSLSFSSFYREGFIFYSRQEIVRGQLGGIKSKSGWNVLLHHITGAEEEEEEDEIRSLVRLNFHSFVGLLYYPSPARRTAEYSPY